MMDVLVNYFRKCNHDPDSCDDHLVDKLSEYLVDNLDDYLVGNLDDYLVACCIVDDHVTNITVDNSLVILDFIGIDYWGYICVNCSSCCANQIDFRLEKDNPFLYCVGLLSEYLVDISFMDC